VTAFPKPAPRPPKPRKRIARRSLPARRTRPRAQRQTKRAASLRSLAYLWRVKVREKNDGVCMIATLRNGHDTFCHGPIQAAHVFGVDEAPGVRLALWNGVPLCAFHHEYFERRKRTDWMAFLLRLWGPSVLAERLGLARSTVKVDLAAAAAELGAA
jgi:hypothetical protein